MGFLKDGDKVKVTIRFRGRQIAHSEIGARVMKEFAERISDAAVVERMPKLEGRHMIMFLAPKQEKPVKAEKEPQKPADAAPSPAPQSKEVAK